MGFIDDKRSVSEYPIKPRRTRGTHAYRARNYFASAVILASTLIGAVFMILPSTDKIRQTLKSDFFAPKEEFGERIFRMQFAGRQKDTSSVEKLMKELGKPIDDSSEEKEKSPQQ